MSRRTKVTARRRAGPEHQVVRVVSTGEGARAAHRREPCPTCPWRRSEVGRFPAEAFRISAHTAYDMAVETFACHESGSAKPATCAGFLLSQGAHNLSVRLWTIRRRFEAGDVCAGSADLFPSYRAMAEANGVAPDDPVLRACRDDGQLDPPAPPGNPEE